MPRVIFAPALARWLTASPGSNVREVACTANGSTVREVIDDVFVQFPSLRGYALDEHGTVRHHVMIYLDGTPVTDKQTLATPVGEGSELYIFQALSGG